MQKQKILRVILFLFFFSTGAVALSVSVLCDDLLEYYRNQQLLRSSKEALDNLKNLNADYDTLLGRLKDDPDVVKRIAPVVLGTSQGDVDTAYPDVHGEQLAAAQRVLVEEPDDETGQSPIPVWLERSSRVVYRKMLFGCGAFLVLISFMWFGSKKEVGAES